MLDDGNKRSGLILAVVNRLHVNFKNFHDAYITAELYSNQHQHLDTLVSEQFCGFPFTFIILTHWLLNISVDFHALIFFFLSCGAIKP